MGDYQVASAWAALGNVASDEACGGCPHALGPHQLVATGDTPMDGGVMICWLAGCMCWATWGTNGLPAVRVPDQAEMDLLRKALQKETA